MAEKKIVVDIKENGEISAETFGFQGTSCMAELDKLLKGLAMETVTEKKPEFCRSGGGARDEKAYAAGGSGAF